jgi:hypothetical protein
MYSKKSCTDAAVTEIHQGPESLPNNLQPTVLDFPADFVGNDCDQLDADRDTDLCDVPVLSPNTETDNTPSQHVIRQLQLEIRKLKWQV